jgi:hypothetical protein
VSDQKIVRNQLSVQQDHQRNQRMMKVQLINAQSLSDFLLMLINVTNITLAMMGEQIKSLKAF